MYRVLKILTDAEVAECRKIAASAPFVDGRITNPHNKTKQNEQLHDASAYQTSSQLLLKAFGRSEEFCEFAFPVRMRTPLICSYPGQRSEVI
jgi:PKHD-type hydroxylase